MVVGSAIRRTVINKSGSDRSYAFDPRLSYVDNRQKGRSSLSYVAEQALPFILIGGAGYLILRNKFGVKSETLDKITDKGGQALTDGLGTVGNVLSGAENLTGVFDAITGKFADVANNAINKDYSGFSLVDSLKGLMPSFGGGSTSVTTGTDTATPPKAAEPRPDTPVSTGNNKIDVSASKVVSLTSGLMSSLSSPVAAVANVASGAVKGAISTVSDFFKKK